MVLPTIRKAVTYRRVSGDSQKDNFSLRSQGNRCAAYCREEGLTILREFVDVGSGLSTKYRPQFIEMLEFAMDETNGATDIVFDQLDRYFRNHREFNEYTDKLVTAGITLHLAAEREKYNFHTEEKWQQRMLEAQKESKRTSIRTKAGQREATRLGYHIGKPPWGYRLAHESEELNDKGDPVICGTLEPDPTTWDDCVLFFKVAGDGLTPMKLSQYMNDHGIPAPNGGEWTHKKALRVLQNPKYHGLNFRGVNPQSRIPGPKEEAPATIVENNHEPAVDYDIWKQINEGIQRRNRTQGPTRAHSSPNPLSCRIKCGECWAQGHDSNLQIHRSKDCVYLRCARRKNMGTQVCSFKGARLDQVLSAIVERITEHFLTEETLQNVVDQIASTTRAYLEEQETSRSGITSRLKTINGQLENIRETIRTLPLQSKSSRFVTDDLENLLEEKEELELKAKAIAEATEEAYLFVTNREGIIETAISKKLFTDPADPEATRELLALFIERVEVFADKSGRIYYDLPIRKAGTEETPGEEAIFFEPKKGPVTPESCVFDRLMAGLSRSSRVTVQAEARSRRFRCPAQLPHRLQIS